MLGFVLDDVFMQHRSPTGHPERVARFEAVATALRAANLAGRGKHIPIRSASEEELLRAHSATYLQELTRTVPGKSGWLDADTYFSPGTWDAALAAAGGLTELTVRALHGELTRGLAVVRPPGHHATRDRAMGFCLINNVAVAAATARAQGAARVAIVDWDVHHGNGTQDIFWEDPAVMYLSVHQYPYYPGTGAPSEIGGVSARGSTINVGLPPGLGDAEYLHVFDTVFVPALRRFRPDLVLVSAGFDPYRDDPLAQMSVTAAGFGAMARRLRLVADEVCEGRMVAVLEGGYDLHGLATGITSVLDAMDAPAAGPRLVEPGAALPIAGDAAPSILATLAAHREATP
ncbi:MAG TPA: histone deacetylase [Kofleriaceae bacterium]|mgnify:CR=1 FL=1|nr:histone deacetylase [Kofleriaceae bacterium]